VRVDRSAVNVIIRFNRLHNLAIEKHGYFIDIPEETEDY
jgi:hypothetical protein